MPYVEGRPIPRGYHVEVRPQSGLILAGLLVFGIPYVLSASTAGSSHETADRWLLLPVAGPLVDLAARPDCTSRNNAITGSSSYCSDDSGTRTLLVFDGLLQAGGAVLTIVGLSTTRHLLVRDDYPYASRPAPHFTLTIAPRSYGRAGEGLTVAGTF